MNYHFISRFIGLAITIAMAFGIEIAIAIIFRTFVGRGIFLDAVTSSTQTAEHCDYAVQFGLSLLAFFTIQRFSDYQNILNRGTFER